MYIAAVVGFFLMLALAIGAVPAWFIGCMPGLPDHFVGGVCLVAAYPQHHAAGTFALISVLFILKDKLTGWPERHRHRVALRQLGAVQP